MHTFLKPFILVPALLTSACSLTPPSLRNTPLMASNEIIQSQNDNRQYQAFTLANELQVLIISDPDSDKAAASLDVFIGSASDPEDRAGLAHFLEHMLFLGTEKYPDPDEYQTFIAQHGGSRNAFTAKEHTNYFFDIENASLEPMLDRFSQFFTAPLFNPEFVEREKNAVHSEYLGKIKTEDRRFYAAMQQAFNPKSPYAKFSVGNLETLADRPGKPVRDDLLRFYKQHYSANLMRLVVLANEPLPVLKKWVTDKFSSIPNQHSSKELFNEPLLNKAQMGQKINIKSLQEKRELTFTFPLPEVQSHYRTKPSAYFQSLLGHEGEGSILALLKEKGWADELSASTGFSNNAQESSLYLGVNLTHAGLQHVDDITDIVFQYIRLLQQTELQQWLYEEQKQQAQLTFRYQEKRDASKTVTDLARNLHYYAPQDVLRGAYLMEYSQPELTQSLLQLLTPERVLIALNSQDVSTHQTEKNYHVDYAIDPITPELRARWSSSAINPALKLPAPNPFMPDQLELKKAAIAAAHPQLIPQSYDMQVWHQLDTSFNVPRSNLFLALHSPIANKSPRDALLSSLLASTLTKQLNSYAYPASLAGLQYSIYATERGLSIALSGYDQKQPALLERIIDALKNPEITENHFTILKNRLQQGLSNAQKQQPFQQILADIKRLLVENRWTDEQKLVALNTITEQDLQEFSALFLQQLQPTLLIQGNTTAQEAQQIADFINTQLALSTKAIQVPATQVIQLKENNLNAHQLTIDNQDAALALYFQAPDKSVDAQAKMQLLGQIVSSAFFADLRTRQQLGYNLGAAALPMKEVPGLIFILQSPVISAPEIESRVRTFITAFLQDLENLPTEELEKYKTGLITHLLEKDKNLQKRSYRNWLEIDRENYAFDTQQRIAAAVKTIDKASLINAYKNWLIDNPRQFRSYALGTKFIKEDFSDVQPITDNDLFKREHDKL
ncbi:MAG: insulinase family protein [Methylococcaceae bacterium]|nr:insulinase family protein [Methylococcaceae bacterium]